MQKKRMGLLCVLIFFLMGTAFYTIHAHPLGKPLQTLTKNGAFRELNIPYPQAYQCLVPTICPGLNSLSDGSDFPECKFREETLPQETNMELAAEERS